MEWLHLGEKTFPNVSLKRKRVKRGQLASHVGARYCVIGMQINAASAPNLNSYHQIRGGEKKAGATSAGCRALS